MAVDMGSAVAQLLLDTSNFNTSLQGAQNSLVSTGAAMSSAGATMTSTITKGFIDVSGKALETTMTFESAMSQVQATMGITADATSELDGTLVNTMGALGDLSKQLGASTKFSANEAAAAINNMAMAGYDVQQIYDSLPTVLSLASAGALDLDYATQLVANGLNVMGLETKDATELADKLAVTASHAYGSVSDFGEGLLKAGGQAKLANVSLTDTMTALGILGDNGISAAEGGTMLRNVLKNLYTPTKDAATALEELGIATTDDEGNLRDFQEVLQDLSGSLDNLTEDERIKAMSRIFDTRTIAGANALLEASGERWDELSESIDDAAGAADKMAKTQLDNLKGQLTILKSSVEGLMLAFGEIMLPVIKNVVELVQKLVDWLNGLDESQKKLVMTIATIVAALGPVLLIGGRIVATIGSLRTSLGGLGSSFGMVGGKVALIAAAIAGLIGLFVKLYKTNDEFREAVQQALQRVKDAFDRLKQTFERVFESLKEPLNNLIEKLSGPFMTVITNILDVVVLLLDSLGPALEKLFGAIVNLVENIPLDSIFESVGKIVSSIGNLVSKILPKIIEIISGIVEKLSPIFDIVDMIFAAISEIIDIVSPFIEEIVSMLQEIIAELPIQEFLEAVGELVSSILGIIVAILPDIIDFLRMLMPIIKTIFETLKPVLETVTAIIKTVAALLRGDWDSAADGFNAIFVGIWNTIKSLWDTFVSVINVIDSFFASWDADAKKFFDSIWQTISGWWNSVVGFLKSIDLKKIGQNILNSLWEGLKSVWNSISSWFEGISSKISGFFGKITGLKSSASQGAYATGLAYVPRTMDVTVHRGERILTQEENKRYNESGSKVEVVTYQNDEALLKLGEKLDRILNAIDDLDDLKVVMDSKRLVGAIKREINYQLADEYANA